MTTAWAHFLGVLCEYGTLGPACLTSDERGNAQPSDKHIVQLLTPGEELGHHIQVRPLLASVIQHVLQHSEHGARTHAEPREE